MKIAIHNKKGSFSDRWIDYCVKNDIDFKLVDCYSNNIMKDLKDCSGLIWHWNQNDYKANLCAKQITLSIESMGLPIFPDVKTSWHFDDKVGQKYLFEALEVPFIKSYVFYEKEDAFNWLKSTTYPKVFKLRGGAGSVNVKLIKSIKEGKKIVKQAFGKGFSNIDINSMIKERFWGFKRDKDLKSFYKILTGIGRKFITLEVNKLSAKQKGYVYFQDFIKNNNFDSRLVVVGNRCFGVRRYCRENDFRASGSGIKAYEQDLFDTELVKIAFEASRKIGGQSLAFDFILDEGAPKIIEVSYCYTMGKFYDDCLGYWDSSLKWYSRTVNPQYFIMEDFIEKLKN